MSSECKQLWGRSRTSSQATCGLPFVLHLLKALLHFSWLRLLGRSLSLTRFCCRCFDCLVSEVLSPRWEGILGKLPLEIFPLIKGLLWSIRLGCLATSVRRHFVDPEVLLKFTLNVFLPLLLPVEVSEFFFEFLLSNGVVESIQFFLLCRP